VQKSPLAIVKERFGDKAGLIKAVSGFVKEDLWLDHVNSDKGLDRVSNRKLLHLHEVLSAVKSEFGSRAKLVDAVAELEGHDKDADYKAGLAQQATPALYDRFRAGKKRKAA